MSSLSTLFFDLDGTLIDPKEGITRCIQYALRGLGVAVPDSDDLTFCIGPPLRSSLPKLLGTEDAEIVEQAVALYRERFSEIGLFENVVYQGIPELLEQLKQEGYRMFVVTSKPTIYSEKIVPHFGLGSFFEGVFGPELDGSFDNKSELIKHLLAVFGFVPAQTLMIGDRKVDIEAGKANRTMTMGVAYGFGSQEELTQAAPDFICETPAEIGFQLRDLVQTLSREDALQLLREHNLSQKVIEHCVAVSEYAVELAGKVLENGYVLDLSFIETASLVHDIGRSRTQGIAHGVQGAEILKHFPKHARVCESHLGGGISKKEAEELGLSAKDYIPQTLEEKIICYADKLISGTEKITLEQCLQKFSKRLGSEHPSIQRIKLLDHEIRNMLSKE